MYPVFASMFFLVAGVGAGAVIVRSLRESAFVVGEAYRASRTAGAAEGPYQARIRRTSRPYRPARPAPVQRRAAA